MRNILYCLPFLFALAAAGAEDDRAKLISAFQIVKFPNDPCVASASSGKNGTCYTKEECSNHGGKADGTCAEGYGVCCIFSIGCGSMLAENNTYFEVNAAKNGRCTAKICKASSNICQIRLDFQTFVITGPSTDTASVQTTTATAPGAGKKFSYASRCLTDAFEVSGAPMVPTLCGTLTGEHVYYDANEECSTLAFNFGSLATGATIPTRNFNVKVTQYACGYNNLAPTGCTQYYFNTAGTGYVTSFNFASDTSHLAEQQQVICVRREQGMCKVCWSADAAIDVILSGKNAKGVTKHSSCCGFGAAGIGSDGVYDCLQIPGARKAVDSAVIKNSEQCGGKKGIVSASDGASATICSKAYPFRVEFFSDSRDLTEAAIVEGKTRGFKLKYFEAPCV